MFRKFLLSLALLVCLPVAAEANNRFAVCTTTCTWDGSSTAMWSTTSGGGTGASVPGINDAVILDAATCVGGTTCTITVNTTVTVQTINQDLCTASTAGCILDFSAHNNNVTLSGTSAFSSSGTATRTLNCGTGIFTLTGPAAIWTTSTATALTTNCTGATFVYPAVNNIASRNFVTGGKNYGTITVGANIGGGLFATSGNATFTSLTISGPNQFTPVGGNTQVFTDLSITGKVRINPTSSLVTFTITNPPTLTDVFVNGITFTNAATGTGYDGGGNTNLTLTAPSGTSGGFIIGGG